MKYRKKPVVIEAERFLAYTEGPRIIDWISKNGGKAEMGGSYYDNSDPGPAYLLIHTLEGVHRADTGDFIIQGVKGEFYPCKPDIFVMTYEKVEEYMQKIILDTIEEFRKKRDELLSLFPEKDGEETETVEFGYKYQEMNTVVSVIDWRNIESFLKQALTKAFEAGQKSREKEIEEEIKLPIV